jgi:hypothetical protein
MKPRRNEEAQAHIGLSSHRKKKHKREIELWDLGVDGTITLTSVFKKLCAHEDSTGFSGGFL